MRQSIQGYQLLHLLLFVRLIVARVTDTARFIGYVVESGAPVSTIYCPRYDTSFWRFEETDLLFCDPNAEDSDLHGIECDQSNLIVSGYITDRLTVTCQSEWPCMTLTVILSTETPGSIISCQDAIGLSSKVDTVYRALPTANLTSYETPTYLPIPSTADEPNKGLSSGGIAGAVIGSIVGAALIGAAIFLWMRHRRNRKNGDDPGAGGGLESPFPTLSRRWMQSSPDEEDKTVQELAAPAPPVELPLAEVPPEQDEIRPVGTDEQARVVQEPAELP